MSTDPTGKQGIFKTHQLDEIASQLAYYSAKVKAVTGVMQANNIDEIVCKNANGPVRARASLRRWLQLLDIAIEEAVIGKNSSNITVTIGTDSADVVTKPRKNKANQK